ncbi:hypothetical protein M0R19_01855 [Candidatus Pacearchaeota archaeon]|nr:hypothetical protein [Candidatus Pacearchaeota archaeon]
MDTERYFDFDYDDGKEESVSQNFTKRTNKPYEDIPILLKGNLQNTIPQSRVYPVKNLENLSTETYISEEEKIKILSKKNPSKRDLARLSTEDLNRAEKINRVQNGGVSEMHYTNPTKGKKNIIKGKILYGASIFLGTGACSIPVNYGGQMTNIMLQVTTGLVVGAIVFGIGAGFNAVGRIQHWYHND